MCGRRKTSRPCPDQKYVLNGTARFINWRALSVTHTSLQGGHTAFIGQAGGSTHSARTDTIAIADGELQSVGCWDLDDSPACLGGYDSGITVAGSSQLTATAYHEERSYMDENPTIATLGRRLRLACIGGGPGSFIGGVHRQAARTDDRYDLVAGVFSSSPKKSQQAAMQMGIADDRAYGDPVEMLRLEQKRADGVDVVAIMTPNDTHFPYAKAALERGFHVICDKPMTNNLEEAQELHDMAIASGLVFCLTHNYTGYPMVRQARAMVEKEALGELRLVQVEYVQGGNAEPFSDESEGERAWRHDPGRAGPSLVLGDIGTHAHNLIRFICQKEVASVSAEVGAIVPGRKSHDYAGALLHLQDGGRGNFWVTQAAAGVENTLSIRVSGSRGTLEWSQETPQRLRYKPIDAPMQTITPNGPGVLPIAARASRIVKGHPEGFTEAFANLYRDAADAIASRIAGASPEPNPLYPTSLDGLRGLQFVEAVLRSSSLDGGWVSP